MISKKKKRERNHGVCMRPARSAQKKKKKNNVVEHIFPSECPDPTISRQSRLLWQWKTNILVEIHKKNSRLERFSLKRYTWLINTPKTAISSTIDLLYIFLFIYVYTKQNYSNLNSSERKTRRIKTYWSGFVYLCH